MKAHGHSQVPIRPCVDAKDERRYQEAYSFHSLRPSFHPQLPTNPHLSTPTTPYSSTSTPPHSSNSTPHHPFTSNPPHPDREKGEKKKKKNFCKVDRRELKKDVSIRKRSLLGPLFKSASVDGKSMGTLTISPTPHRLFPVCGTRENILSYGHISLKRRKCFPE